MSTRHGVSVRLTLAFSLLLLSFGAAWGQIPGKRLGGARGKTESTASIMERQAAAPEREGEERPEHELEYPSRVGLPQHPKALAVAQFPAPEPGKTVASDLLKIHTTALSFDGATLTDTGAFPPDSMGTVGPTPVRHLRQRPHPHVHQGGRGGRRDQRRSRTCSSPR